MRTPLLLPVLLITVVSILSCNAQKDKELSPLDAFISKKGDSVYKSSKVPGIFIGVLNNGKRQYYNFGFADPEKKMPFDSLTVFEIGSITKTFTAYILESVLKEKSISDSNSILPYLPDSVRSNTALKNISFLSLMNHTSGLPRLPGNMDLKPNDMTPYDYYTADHLFSYLKECVPEPDGRSNYSNLGAGLGGVLAERISGKSFTTLLDQYIFSPFKIKRYPNESIAQIKNKAQGYSDLNYKSDYWNMNILAPAGDLKSTADDMLTYLQVIANPVNDGSKQIIGKLLEKTANVSPVMNVCRGWHTIEEKNKPVIYFHDGGTYGFSTFGGFLKDQSKAVIIVVNQFNKNDLSDWLGPIIMKKLMD